MSPSISLIPNDDGSVTQRTDEVITRQSILDQLSEQETQISELTHARNDTLVRLSTFDAIAATPPAPATMSNEPPAATDPSVQLDGAADTPSVDLNVTPADGQGEQTNA